MESDGQEPKPHRETLIASFVEIASSTSDEALFFLESHNWDLDAAVTTYLDDDDPTAAAAAASLARPPAEADSQAPQSPEYNPSRSPSRSRSPSPAQSRRKYELRSRGGGAKKASGSRAGGVRTLADLNRQDDKDSMSDSDDPQEYYTGGEKSGMLVQDPNRSNDVDAIFNQAKQAGSAQGTSENIRPSSSTSRSFTGAARSLAGETISSAPQPPEVVVHRIVFWRNGFSVDDGPRRSLDDPENAPFLESIKKSECPQELAPADRRTSVHVEMMRRDEDYHEPVKQRASFQGVGRTLASSNDPTPQAASETIVTSAPLNAAPPPSMGLVVDDSSPTTSLQLRLADGTRMVSRFNHHHTIRDVMSFIDASRPGGPRSYQLQTVGFPPKRLTELDQTIEQAGIANSVVVQKL